MQVNQAIREIKDRLNIVDIVRRYADLKPNGSRFTAPCPFHQETKPSFSVNPEKGFFYCFGCHASGDIFEFYSKINGIDFRETLEQLAAEAGITVEYGADEDAAKNRKNRETAATERQTMLRMHEFASRFFKAALKDSRAEDCRKYIQKRGLSPEIVEHFELGWAPADWHSLVTSMQKAGFNLACAKDAGLAVASEKGNYYDRFRGRLIFPIKNLSNQIIAFGGRIIADVDEAKYINSADTPIYKKKEHLFGLSQARRGITSKGFALLTEGYMDVLTLHQYGYDNGVGVLGTALTAEQIKRLSGFTSRVLLIFDGDRAGRKAALRSSEMLLARGLSCKVAILPEAEDIDSLLRSRGSQGFEEIRSQAPDGLEFCVDVLKELAPREAIEWAKNFISQVEIPELASPYATKLARHLEISEEELRKSVAGESRAPQIPELRSLKNIRDQQILIFAARYPHKLEELRSIGADLALSSPEARQFWDVLEQWGPDEAFYHFNEQQKTFWQKQRGPGSAPLDNCDYELSCLKNELDAFYVSAQRASLSAALAEKASAASFDADLEYLRALQETVEKNNEQS